MANFRPKRSILDPLLPKGANYKDTLENFLKPKQKRAKKKFSEDYKKKVFDNAEDFC